MTREDFSHLKRPLIIGWDNVWGSDNGSSDHAPNDFYIDDVYMDASWSRVEIGNAPTYDACTYREVQVPRSWTSNSIEVQTNAGSLASFPRLYLYVTDENGQVNSTGFIVKGSPDAPFSGSLVENPPPFPEIPPTTPVDPQTDLVNTPTNPGGGDTPIDPVNPGTTPGDPPVDPTVPGDTPNTQVKSEKVHAEQKFLRPGDNVAFGPDAAEVEVRDETGKTVATKTRTGGNPPQWNGLDEAGRTVESGVYMIRITSLAGSVFHQPIVVVK
jgi:hypothetical protein